MNRFASACAIMLLIAAAAPVQASPANDSGVSAGAARLDATRDARARCREEAKTQGLKGDARKTAVKTCFAKAMPHEAAALQCRADGHAKGLTGTEFRKFTKQCRANAA